MNGAINLGKLMELRKASLQQTGGDVESAEGAGSPAPAEEAGGVESPAPVGGAVSAPPPGMPPLSALVLSAEEGEGASAADDAAKAQNPVPAEGDGLAPVAEQLYTAITSAGSPEEAQKIVIEFLQEHGKAAREAAMKHLPKAAENLAAAVAVWEKAANSMFALHPHLKDYGELLDTLAKDEYTKDPKRSPDDLYKTVAERANKLLRLPSTGKPSLPEAASGTVPIGSPQRENISELRLRQLRGK